MNRTVFIGLDGATFDVLDYLMERGHMPVLRGLIERGVRAPLMSTPHPLTPPAWTTVMTGRNPGSHGIFDFLRSPGSDGKGLVTLNNFRDIRCETLWTLISRQGGKLISLNFPLLAPPPHVSGAIVPGLLSWRHLRRNVFPREIFDELKALPGFDSSGLSWDFEHEKKALQHVPDEELEGWVRFHIEREELWMLILRHLMKRESADFIGILLDGVDKLQHACWRFLDPEWLPQNPSEFESHMIGLCIEYFDRVDAIIGEILEAGGPEQRVFFASDHGFGPTLTSFRVNKWLEQNGYLKWSHPGADGDSGRSGGMASPSQVPVDWEFTTAYAPSPATNGIHIKLAADPGEAGVRPEDYPGFRERLIYQLTALREPGTERPLFKNILKREDVFAGAYMDGAPDLTLELFDHGFVSVLDLEPVIAPRPKVTGTHRPDGVFIASGAGIRGGARLPEQPIVDVAPTLLYSLGLPIPEDFEGSVIEGAFEPEQLAQAKIETGAPTLSPEQLEAGGAESEAEVAEGEDLIMNRLRALGYVE